MMNHEDDKLLQAARRTCLNATGMGKKGGYRFPAATRMRTRRRAAGKNRNVNNLFMGRDDAGVKE